MRPLVVGMACLALGGCGIQQALRPAGPAPAPLPAERPQLAPGEVAVTWLGAAGALVRTHDKTIAFDPYVSRHHLGRVIFGNVSPDKQAIDRYLPKVDLVLVGHSHHDHLVDVPYLVQRDNAQLVGTLTTSEIAQSHGVDIKNIHVVGGGELIDVDGVLVDVVKAGHGTWRFGKVPSSGVVESRQGTPMRASQFKMGGALFYRVVVDGIRIGHLSSGKLAQFLPKGIEVDVLLLSLAASSAKDKVMERLLPATRPTFLLPIHFDMFFLDLEENPRRLPGYDVDEVVTTASVLSPGVRVVVPDPMREQVLNIKTRKVR
ncbi:MAG: MBL fold metallo-hydrolase [Myxococcota bacterium]